MPMKPHHQDHRHLLSPCQQTINYEDSICPWQFLTDSLWSSRQSSLPWLIFLSPFQAQPREQHACNIIHLHPPNLPPPSIQSTPSNSILATQTINKKHPFLFSIYNYLCLANNLELPVWPILPWTSNKSTTTRLQPIYNQSKHHPFKLLAIKYFRHHKPAHKHPPLVYSIAVLCLSFTSLPSLNFIVNRQCNLDCLNHLHQSINNSSNIITSILLNPPPLETKLITSL